MDLLLTHGYFLREDPKEAQIMKPYVTLGVLYISSHLRRKGFAVEIFDSTFSSLADLLEVLRTTPPSVLGVYANLMTRGNVVRILQAAKEYGWTTVVGGPDTGAYIPEYLAAGADIVVRGEGELTLQELLPALRARERRLDGIAGISFRCEDGHIVHTPPRALIKDLDGQPWPDRERVNLEQYLQTWRNHHGQSSVSVICARGCAYRCRWCSHSVFGMTHRRRRAAAVVDEVEWILHRYSPDMLWMADDVFTIHHGWLFQYATEMKRRGLRIPFECISRADRITPQVADTLAELGCFRVWIGSESGSQRILDAMERGVSVREVQDAVACCKSRGIATGMFLMWGYEGEELADIEATVAHVKQSDPDIFFTTVSYPIKGTPYYEQVTDRVVRDSEWAAGSDRDHKIRGRHSRAYYRFADQLLRSEVERKRLLSAASSATELAALERKIAEARAGLQATAAEVEA